VQIGTASFRDAAAAINVLHGLDAWLREQNVLALTDLIGSLELG